MSGWSVEDLGRGTYRFIWDAGFYTSPFVVTDEGVVVFDPINRDAAAAYRDAISTVTKAPIRSIIYSHDHRDHIVGADVLDPNGEVEILAHTLAAQRIARRKDKDIPPPTRLIGDSEVLQYGAHRIELHYFGPNHSDSNLAIVLPTDAGRFLVFSDVLEPGLAPYRNLPDTDLGGLMDSLDRAIDLNVDLVMGGHAPPGKSDWLPPIRQFFDDLVAATDAAFAARGGHIQYDEEDGVAMTERMRRETCEAAAARLEDRYGHWAGFQAWAPQTADRVLSYLITGN